MAENDDLTEAGADRTPTALDWDSIPANPEPDWFKSIPSRHVIEIEKNPERLTDSQREAFEAMQEDLRRRFSAVFQAATINLGKTSTATRLARQWQHKRHPVQFAVSRSMADRVGQSLTAPPVGVRVPTTESPAQPETARPDPLNQSLRQFFDTSSRQHRDLMENEATTQGILSDMRDATSVVADDVRSNRLLTYILAFAVLYDVVNGSFDDHTIPRSLIAGAIAGAVLAAIWGVQWAWTFYRAKQILRELD